MKTFVARLLLRAIMFFRDRYLYLMDHVYTAGLTCKFAKCGKDVHFYYPCHISGPQSVEMGNNVHINRGAFIRAEGGLKVGDNVHIARNVVIYTLNHNYKGDALPYDHTFIRKPVVIEKNVWIGINVTITPGVTIGKGAIIGAGTIVSKDVPPLAIVGSAPQTVIRFRDKSHYTGLERMHRYGGVNGKLYRVEE